MMESILLNNGYTKYDPDEYFYIQIFMDCYENIFKENFYTDNPGIDSIWLDINDGLIYNLLYPLELKGLPNILVIAYLQENGKIFGYYKMNYGLKGIIMSTNYGELLVFL